MISRDIVESLRTVVVETNELFPYMQYYDDEMRNIEVLNTLKDGITHHFSKDILHKWFSFWTTFKVMVVQAEDPEYPCYRIIVKMPNATLAINWEFDKDGSKTYST